MPVLVTGVVALAMRSSALAILTNGISEPFESINDLSSLKFEITYQN